MSSKTNALGSKIIKGTFWAIGMRWSSRLMGLASMVVIARLLTPEDFGVIAVATSIIGLIETFTDLGTDTALIRHPNPERKHFDTAWTFSILVHLFSAGLIAIAGYYSKVFYDDPRYEPVLYVLSLSLLISGLGNVGFINYRRNLDFHKDFILNFVAQLAGIVVTLWLAFELRNYWALVFGMLTRSIIRPLMTYILHSYKPRFSLAAYHELVGFSFWIMVRSLALFMTNRADRLVLAVYYSPSILGLYTIAGELATMAVFELLHPFGRALFPALAKKQNDQQWLKENVTKIFNITATLAVATGVGLASIAEPALSLVYGAKYTEASYMLVILCVLSAINGINQPIGEILLIMNKARDYALLYILEGIATIATVYFISINHFEFLMVLYGRLAVSSFAMLRLFYLLRTIRVINLFGVFSAWIRPIMAGAAMFFMVDYLRQQLIGMPTGALVPMSIFIGALTFSVVLLFTWWVMRKPSGMEEEILERFFKKTSRPTMS